MPGEKLGNGRRQRAGAVRVGEDRAARGIETDSHRLAPTAGGIVDNADAPVLTGSVESDGARVVGARVRDDDQLERGAVENLQIFRQQSAKMVGLVAARK